MIKRSRKTMAMLAASAGMAAAGIVMSAAPAFAAGTGYGPTGTPSAPSGYTTVVVSKVISTGGGTVSATFDGQHITVSVPAGDFSSAVQVSVTAPASPPAGALAAYAISFAQNGATLTGTLAKPVSFTITASSITVGDAVNEWSGTGWVKYSDATVANGSVVITFTSDPAFEVTTATVTPIPGATTATTGVPIDGFVAIAGGLLLIGALGLFVTRRRRTCAN